MTGLLYLCLSYGEETLHQRDILKPNVLKSGVDEQSKLQDTTLMNTMGFKVIRDVSMKFSDSSRV